mgnify:CR=1 FL=1
MECPATFDDVKARSLRPVSESNRAWVETRLGDAWELLKSKVHALEDRITSGDLSLPLVVATLAESVNRVLKNPNSVRSTGVDDAQVTIDYTVASGRLYFLDEEIEALLPTVALSGAYSIPFGIPYWGR